MSSSLICFRAADLFPAPFRACADDTTSAVDGGPIPSGSSVDVTVLS